MASNSVRVKDRDLTKSSVTLTGSSQTLLAADPGRLVVYVSSTATNSSVAVDPTGGTASLDGGIPVPAGNTLAITDAAAKAAMTVIGTSGDKLTVYTG